MLAYFSYLSVTKKKSFTTLKRVANKLEYLSLAFFPVSLTFWSKFSRVPYGTTQYRQGSGRICKYYSCQGQTL
jgi:hypothetical protein